MTYSIIAEIKLKMLVAGKEYWPIIVALIFAYLGVIVFSKDDGYVVQAVCAVGVAIFLPLFGLQKNIWLYIVAFGLCGINDIGPEGARRVADLMGLVWLNTWTASMIVIAVQGAVAAFVYLLLLYVVVFRLQGSAALVFKVPICVFFLLAALTPAFFLLWLIAGVTGLLGPI